MANEHKTQTEVILEILGGNTSSTKPADIIEDRAKVAKVAIERLDEAMGHYASHKDDVRDELKSVTETIKNIINK
tara:strand:+ start:453 stop:677 length:225 start_codon:yes stop_codon:yes gene_type:complete